MSTDINAVPPSILYPLRFQVTAGPTFARIGAAAPYYHDPEFDMPLRFTGILTDTVSGTSRKVRLKARVYGYWSGTDHADGWVHVYMHLEGYHIRFGTLVKYNFKRGKDTPVLELCES